MSTTATATTPTGSRRRRPSRGLLLGAALLLLVGVVAVLLPGGEGARPLDPGSAGSEGSRALAQVLARNGVDVEPVRSVEELQSAHVDGRTTLLVADAGLMSQRALQVLADLPQAHRLVLVEPNDAVLEGLDIPAILVGRQGRLTAGCRTDLSAPEDTISAGALVYRPESWGVTACFRPDQDESGVLAERTTPAALLTFPSGGSSPETVVLGQHRILTNADITRESHAALALRLLGDTDRVVWYVPTPDEADPPLESDGPAAPAWSGPALAVLALSTLLLCLWRGRRLGPLAVEPLPVVVPASETTSARARLYERADDRDAVLRMLTDAALADLRARLRLPTGATPDEVAHAVHAATGDDVHETTELLTGRAQLGLGEHAARLRRLRRKVRLS